MKIRHGIAIIASAVAASLSIPAAAQIGGPFAPPLDAMDELSGAPVGGGAAFGGAMDRARGAVDMTQGGMGAQPGQFQQDPFGAPQDPFGGQQPFGQPFGGPIGFQQPGQQFEIPRIATVTAWGGERILDVRTGEILQDAREIQVLPEFAGGPAGRYFDDGESFNDAVAGDGIYTNITVSREYIGPESHFVRTRLIQTLRYFSDLQPMDFFLVRAASTEPLTSLPRVMELEERMDANLEAWLDMFVADYRLDPDNRDSELIPSFLPPPPRAPNKPLPTNFTPRPPEDQQPGMMGAPGMYGDPGMMYMDPMGAEMGSRYF